MNVPVITAAPAAAGSPQIFAIALPSGHGGLKGRGVWIYEVENDAISRQRIISLGEARALHSVLANPALPDFLFLGTCEAHAMRLALGGAIRTFELAETLAPNGNDNG